MSSQPRFHAAPSRLHALGHRLLALWLLAAPWTPSGAAVDLADQPLFSTSSVPANLLLALSVEFPTALSPAYHSSTAYSSATVFIGYFDPGKCYKYMYNTVTPSASYFTPSSTTTTRTCSSTSTNPLWSGNYLNWASMGALDTFRMVMTGGQRAAVGSTTATTGDTATETILEKAYNYNVEPSQPKNTPDKTVATAGIISGATPFTWSSVTTKVWHQGTAMLITGTYTTSSSSSPSTCNVSKCVDTGGSISPVVADATTYIHYNAHSSAAGTANQAKVYKLYMRVKVCDSSVGVESNCVTYGSAAKPEGLMQSHASKLRFSAFGYLADGSYTSTAGTTNKQRDGGVMRARMKYIGPTQPVPGSSAISNSSREWNATTGVMVTNPDSADASDTVSTFGLSAGAVSNSGVMNYLNKFGQSLQNYKTYDPISELYYAGLRYYKGLGNVPEYTNGTTAALSDGFPVITKWRPADSSTMGADPIVYSCQKNFILGIGDVNTAPDANLYGSTIRSSDETTMPATVSADVSVNVKTATDMVGKLEGVTNLGSVRPGSANSYFIAGLAYDAHTKDIRSDLTGKQTVSTYWLDVEEYQTYVSKNQYWLAAKYGGFTVSDSFLPYATTNGTSTLALSDWYTSSDTVNGTTDKRPDNYFEASQADLMKAGLTKAFAKITSESAAAASTAYTTASPNVKSGGASYGASYAPNNWTGKVTASTVSYDAAGTPTLTAAWDASTLLDAMALSSRKIITYCDRTAAGIPFQATNLTACASTGRTNYASFASVPGATLQSATNYLAYLRGSRAQEVENGGQYRTRTDLLGDIVGSKVNAVSAPAAPYYDAYNPGYSSFKKTYATRTTVVYAGSNDGMLHAFDGSLTGTSAGSELFAYVPSFVYGTTSSAGTTGLASLGNPSFTHHYMVDATPRDFDVDFNKTSGIAATVTTNDWRTILIGGLGKGGKGYYAIDVTNPSAWTSETVLAGKVLWEFPSPTDSTTIGRMGYTYGDPSVVKTAKYGWVVIFSSGYNNSNGIGYFFIVNPRTGALLETVATSTTAPTVPLNMGHQIAFIPDYANYTADAVYAGDLQGNVWRLDLTGTPTSYPAPTKIAQLYRTSGTPQPITARPTIDTDPSSKKRYLLVGTGQLLADSDISSTAIQSFYAIADGTSSSGGFYSSAPAGYTFPITRSQLNANTNLINGIGSAPDSAMGWYLDLSTDASSGIAERINISPESNRGIVAFAANLPNGQACNPSGTSRTFAVSFAKGSSVLTNSAGEVVSSSSNSNGVATDLVIQRVNGETRLYRGDSSGASTNLPANLSSTIGLTKLNWREVPAQD